MKRIIGIICISLFLFGICLSEELLVSSSLNQVTKDSEYLYNLANQGDSVNSTEIITKTKSLKEYWAKREHLLCFFINYKDMSEMSNEITRMLSYAQENIKEEYIASLSLVLYYCETFDHITGFNFQNIF